MPVALNRVALSSGLFKNVTGGTMKQEFSDAATSASGLAVTVKPLSSNEMRGRLRSIFSGSVGNLIEWYDWYVYSAFALYFAKSFFPAGDTTAQLLNTAAVFAVGFLARPLGGWLMGLYADRHGRRSALLVSVVMMCLGSIIIALCPDYQSIGAAAPALLVFARLLQGLSIGGEYGTSATYLSEIATAKHRGFYSSFQYVTLIMGQLTAIVLLIDMQQFLLTAAQLESWGWRVPFFIGAACALIGMRLRATMEETGEFEKARRKSEARGTLAELAKHPRAVLTVVGLTMGGTVFLHLLDLHAKVPGEHGRHEQA
jgi:MFS transporter, MHS family, alpha-ketoglutarate permease